MKWIRSQIFLSYIIVIILLKHADTTLSKKGKKTKTKTKKSKSEGSSVSEVIGPTEKNVYDRDLITEKVKAADVLKYYQSYSKKTNQKNLKGDLLGYVTPWNNHGYDVAKIFGGKFSMISPVWLQIKKRSTGQFVMDGSHDIDTGWIKELRNVNNKMIIVPRVLFDGWSVSDFHTLFQSRERLYELVDYIVGFLEQKQFDGMVLEVWVQYGGHYKAELSGLVKELGEAMISKNMKFVLAIPPPLYSTDMQGLFTKDDFDVLSPVVDYFSLMTYDYPHHGSPGAVAPFDWIRQCIHSLAPTKNNERAKILMGLNFYGMDYKTGGAFPIVGKSYIEVLKLHNPNSEWLENDREHKVTFSSQGSSHAMYYPTLKSIYDRISLADDLGTGVAIWELGQGLDYFYDLL